MGRLYDRIVARGYLSNAKVSVVDITNVFRYYETHGVPAWRDLGAVTPPFTHTFLELCTSGGNWWGVLLVRTELTPEQGGTYYLDEDYRIPEGAKWLILAQHFLEVNRRIESDQITQLYCVDSAGGMMDSLVVFYPDELEGLLIENGIDPGSYGSGLMDPYLLACSFMNTKNVELVEQIPPAALSKKHERKHGVPLTKYHVIKVNPMRTVKRLDGDGAINNQRESINAIPTALHIQRGHFKDYRNGPGLFGKYKDIFWWDQHVRGDESAGTVVKDYEVQAPNDKAQESTD